jgi:hypothetical protein
VNPSHAPSGNATSGRAEHGSAADVPLDGGFDTRSILSTAPYDGVDVEHLEPLHDREYRVRAFRLAADRVLIRGAVRDQKPPGLYIDGDERPLTIHHMQVDLEIAFPSLEIVRVEVGFETHPHHECPSIIEHYRSLVGLSIARGFTHRVRELFGGPRGCTHTTALLQAMAPVAVQCFWSMNAADAGIESVPAGDTETLDRRRALWRTNVNTCHVWSEDGELLQRIQQGDEFGTPLFLRRRVEELGLQPGDERLRLHR